MAARSRPSRCGRGPFGRGRAAEAVLASVRALPRQGTRPRPYEGESSPGADAIGRTADITDGVSSARLRTLQQPSLVCNRSEAAVAAADGSSSPRR